MAERARTTSRDCQSSPREERTPEGVGRCRTVTALPSDWVTTAGHDHELIFKVSSPSAFLPSFAFFFPLPPPSLCFTQHTLISPPRYLRLSCHNAKGTLVTDMVHGYGLWEGEVCSSLPRATSEKATCGAAHKQARERFGFNVGVACPMGCPAPRQRGEGKERVRSGSSSSS